MLHKGYLRVLKNLLLVGIYILLFTVNPIMHGMNCPSCEPHCNFIKIAECHTGITAVRWQADDATCDWKCATEWKGHSLRTRADQTLNHSLASSLAYKVPNELWLQTWCCNW